MRLFATIAMGLFAFCSCSSVPQSIAAPSSAPAANQLSQAQQQKIGRKIWQNECAGTVAGLTTWNKGEEFPSMGIGHFIWYPAGFQGRWTESFPSFIAFAKASGRNDIPAWVLNSPDCPWNSRASFIADFNGPRLSSLRHFLANSVSLQTSFILSKSQAALPKMLAAAPAASRARIQQNYQALSATSNGAYALIDYVNFKGEGINPTERYKGEGWGLLQVLTNMRPHSGGQDATKAFSESAKRMLDRRIANSPPSRGEARWRAGWHKRCETYAQPL